MTFKRVPGTKDILPPEVCLWQEIEALARKTFSIYNYKELRTPLLEEAGLFSRSLGESAEIVQKQMFLIPNKEDLYALRPEGTASIVRSYIENNLHKTGGLVKFYYIGPMFRLERPQKGRLRQFHHLGCEVIGSQDPYLDVELISLTQELLEKLSISGYAIEINSLGCPQDKKTLSAQIKEGLAEKEPALCPECRQRLQKNSLRIMDCKKDSCRAIVKGLHIDNRHLCAECAEHFKLVRSALETLKIKYRFNPHLVRGLDYYHRTVFEITHPQLGSQDAIGAGGRYNNLVKELGGPDAGAVGFAFGMERILLAGGGGMSGKEDTGLVFLIALGEEAKKTGIKVLDALRKKGFVCDTDYEGRSVKGAMRRANDLKARYVLIVGEEELKKNSVTLKDMVSGTQKEIGMPELAKELECSGPTPAES